MSRDALVVGINTYQHLPPLTASANDAEAIAQQLSQDNYFLVWRLPEFLDPFEGNVPRVAQNAEVNKTVLEDEILRLFLPQAQRTPETALFYFSGHGLRKERGITEGFLATSDVNSDEDRWGISLKWLREILKQSQIPQQVVWLDCCFAAEFLNYEEANPKGRDRCFISAAREFEKSWQDANSDYSVITKFIVQGLNPHYQPDGIVDNYRLIARISQTLKEAKQRPVFFNVGEPILLIQSRSNGMVDPTVHLQPDVCPYKGLAAFDSTEEDVRFFYGRTALTDELLETIWQQSFLAVLGPSGSGKSSVVRAGLIHAIKQGEKRDTKHWHILPVIKPGENPISSLAEAFVPASLTVRQKEKALQNYIQSLQERGSSALTELVEDYAPNPVLLVIDQFEEIFTLCQNDQERQQFLACLLGASNHNPIVSETNSLPLRVVITIRADFLGKCLEQDYSGLAEQIKTNTVPITPLNRDELRDAIIKPASQVGLRLEPGLVERIIMDVQDSPGSLPLLQYALTELWEQWYQGWQQNGAATGNTLALDGYTETGGVKGALEKQANKVYDSLSELEQTIAKRIFLELTQLGEGTEDTRRRITKRELVNDQHPEELLDQVIHKLTNARLIVIDERNDGTLPQIVLDVAHEALIRHWAELRQWVNEDRDALRTERKLRVAAQEWQGKEQQVAYLWLGARLAEAVDYYQQNFSLGRLDRLTETFIQASQAEQKRIEHEREQQVQKLNEALTLSKLQEQAARARYLTLQQARNGLELAVQAVRENLAKLPDQLVSSVKGSLQQAMAAAYVSNKFKSDEFSTTSVAFSPDGRVIVSGNAACTLQLWDLQGNPVSQPFKGHEAGITSVTFSPDGQKIVSGSHDKTLRLWNLQGKLVQIFVGHEASITSVTFSPDGKRILSGSWDNTLRLWDLEGNQIGYPFQGHAAWVNSVAFSPNGKIIASGSYDRTIRLWDLKGNPVGQPFIGHWASVTSIAFSPNGKIIASGSYDRTIRLWDLKGNPVGQPFIGHQEPVTSVAFSMSGQVIISSSDDQTIRLWGVSSNNNEKTDLLTSSPLDSDERSIQLSSITINNEEIDKLWESVSSGFRQTSEWWDLQGYLLSQPLQGHKNSVTSIAISPDGKTLVSSSDDQTVRLWSLESNPIEDPFQGHGFEITSAAFSPNGQIIMSASGDGTIRLLDLQGNPIGDPFRGHSFGITSTAFSPNGQMIVSSGYDRTIRLWDLQGNPIGDPFRGHEAVNSVAFSPNGQMIVSSGDGTIRLWDLQGNPIGDPFRGHKEAVNSVAFSPDGQMIMSASSDGTIRLWNLQGNPIGDPFRGHSFGITSAAFSPNGQMIVSGSNDETIRLWDLQGHPIIEPFQGHARFVASVAFSPDGQMIVSGGKDKVLRLWDLQGNPIGEPFRGHKEAVNSVAFSPDGQMIMSASSDTTVRLWRGNWQSWLKVCCDRLAYHLISENPEIDIAQTACAVCIQHAWSGTDLAKLLKRQGNDLARQGKPELALIKFEQAAASDPTLNLDPEAEVLKWKRTVT